MSKLEFAIVGGGISGLVLAIALHHRNINVTIYEQAKHFGEIGAGVAFTGNAIQAMKICHPGVHKAFETVCTQNQWEAKKDVWFDFYDAHGNADAPEKYAFTITTNSGHGTAGVHRARFLDEMIKLLPEGKAHFNKKLDTLAKTEDNRWCLRFLDGSTATADAVIGCDGIKSRVRQLLYGENHPCAHPTYTHKYAYRALAKMEDAIRAVGEEKAQNSCAHMGDGAHVLTFPVDHGKTMNLVGFVTTKDEWPDHSRLTKPAHREDALRDFKNFGSDVNKLLHLCHPDLDVWAIFHLGDNPLPYYNKGSLCLLGDAAHATSPHHGSGAGMCIEDSAVMAELLASDGVESQADVEVAFQQFNDLRRERGNWLVQSSAHQGNLYEWLAPGIGKDFAKMEDEINRRNRKITEVDVQQMCNEARSSLASALESGQA